MSDEVILYEVSEGIAKVTLNRPDRLNAVTQEMTGKLKQSLDDACKDPMVKVIILTGAGRGFCAGADMQGLSDVTKGGSRTTFTPEERDYESNGLSNWEGTYNYFPSLPKPIIAAINGPAAGVGFVMSLFCDIRFAKKSAVFSSAFAKRGLIAEYGSAWILPRLVGLAHANDILFSSRKFDAIEAERMGLVNRAINDELFEEEVLQYAKDLSKLVSPRSLRVMKTQIYSSQTEDIEVSLASAVEEMRLSFDSDDFKEGVAHYIEKRDPKFTGK
ncbi:MAG: enoyl-CoA hydratase [SAR86 cluster bacterium]|nr:enoyl-CoA hydratase [SAR86 cluster bacterium]